MINERYRIVRSYRFTTSLPVLVIELTRVQSAFEREPLRRAFGFKGGYLTAIWQTVAFMESRSGHRSTGLGSQSVLWSDPAVFAEHSEDGGNALMFAVLDFALHEALGTSFQSPLELLDELYPRAHEYAARITGRKDLRRTFALNALVALDNAAWVMYARENELGSFDEMAPPAFRPPLSYRHDYVASIPTVGFGVPADEMRSLAEAGYYVVKLKLGHPGSPDEMLERDMQRLRTLHDVFGGLETDRTDSGRPVYYLDINGRYESKDDLLRLLGHAERIGAFEHILLVEEPFPEDREMDVSGLGVRLAADESAHTDADARRLMDLGYGAIALKPVAKTVSMTLKIAREAYARGVPCFCADLTVNPVLVDWNKCFAARLAPLPGLEVGLLETNGRQNYANWTDMAGYHPRAGASWMSDEGGQFHLSDDFFEQSAGILETPEHYHDLVAR